MPSPLSAAQVAAAAETAVAAELYSMSAEDALAYLSGPAAREAGVKVPVIASCLPVLRDAVAREQAAAKKAVVEGAAAEETPVTESISASEAADPSPPPPPPPPPPPATPTMEDPVAKAKAIRAAFDARVAAERAARDD